MLLFFGICYIIYIFIKAAIDDAYIQEQHRRQGFDTYRSVDGKLRHTSSGKALNNSEIRDYYK